MEGLGRACALELLGRVLELKGFRARGLGV